MRASIFLSLVGELGKGPVSGVQQGSTTRLTPKEWRKILTLLTHRAPQIGEASFTKPTVYVAKSLAAPDA